ncbi:flagellar protein FlgA [Parafrigoribacterium mesophilum]|uniref:SAF domain-containing protein n=1 Tax=Parafrigoribacterium mesophilum TaxID=433646 RepID=UPI0031FCB281
MPRKNTAPVTERTPRSFWFDPRFAIGVCLILASVVGVLWIVSNADRTVQVLSAAGPLSPGDRVAAADFGVQSVRLGSAGDKYLTRSDVPKAGVVVTRAVAAGELVPLSAVGSVEGLDVASVVVGVHGELPQAVAAGTVVDLWSAHETEQHGVFGAPAVLVSSATVVRVITPDGLVAGSTQSVELLVSRSKTASVLEAVANQDAMSVVPVSLPAKG